MTRVVFGRRVWAAVGSVAVVISAGCSNAQREGYTSDQTPYDAEGYYDESAADDQRDSVAFEPAVQGGSNQAGRAPALVEVHAGPRPQAQTGRAYVVARGDTLWSIAKRVYGDGQKWKEIVRVNLGLQPTKLRVGQEILLP